jgi:hypothetical protein
VKLFGAQRRETAKPLQFLELMKAMFNCGGNTTQQSAGVRRHKGNALDPRNGRFPEIDDAVFTFFQERRKTGLFVSYDLFREEAMKKARSLNIPRSHLKASKGWAIRYMCVGRRYAKSSQKILNKSC